MVRIGDGLNKVNDPLTLVNDIVLVVLEKECFLSAGLQLLLLIGWLRCQMVCLPQQLSTDE